MGRRNQKTGKKEGGRKGEKEIKIEKRTERKKMMKDEKVRERGKMKDSETDGKEEKRKEVMKEKKKKRRGKGRRKGERKGGKAERQKGGKEQRKRGAKHSHKHPCDLTLGDFILLSHEIRAECLPGPKSPSHFLYKFTCTSTDLQHNLTDLLSHPCILRRLLSKLPSPCDACEGLTEPRDWKTS